MSTLTELFGQGNNAYFSNGPLTRLSFLRSNNALLHKASTAPSTRYLTFDNLNPLSKDRELVFVGYKDVEPIIGTPYEKDEKTLVAEFDPAIPRPALVFLGMNLEGSDAVELSKYHGTPYFALDVTASAEASDDFKKKQAALGNEHTPTQVNLKLSQPASAIYSQARSLLDWNERNLFCSSCGGRTMSTNGGAKVICPPHDAGRPRRACRTRTGLHNQAFPRTDPTVIIAPLSTDASRVLLGRNKRWPENYWSCLSGFVEPGESIEQAVRRETYEEAGLGIGRVQIHSTQPWPYPSSLLIGTMAQCEPGREEISYPETELEQAKWFELEEIEHALENGANAMWEPPIKGYGKLYFHNQPLDTRVIALPKWHWRHRE